MKSHGFYGEEMGLAIPSVDALKVALKFSPLGYWYISSFLTLRNG